MTDKILYNYFVLECTLYAEIRRTYIDKIYYLRPNVVKFVELLTSHNPNVNRKLAMYVFKAITKTCISICINWYYVWSLTIVI